MPTVLPTIEERIAACEELYRRAPIFAYLHQDPPVLGVESCTQRWAFGPEHRGMNQTMHGGMICVLADSLSAFVVTMALGVPLMTTTDLTVQFLRPIYAPAIGVGKIIKGGRTFATVQVEVSEEGKAVGALVIMKLLLL